MFILMYILTESCCMTEHQVPVYIRLQALSVATNQHYGKSIVNTVDLRTIDLAQDCSSFLCSPW